MGQAPNVAPKESEEAVSKAVTGCGTPGVIKALPKTAFDAMEKSAKVSVLPVTKVKHSSRSRFCSAAVCNALRSLSFKVTLLLCAMRSSHFRSR